MAGPVGSAPLARREQVENAHESFLPVGVDPWLYHALSAEHRDLMARAQMTTTLTHLPRGQHKHGHFEAYFFRVYARPLQVPATVRVIKSELKSITRAFEDALAKVTAALSAEARAEARDYAAVAAALSAA